MVNYKKMYVSNINSEIIEETYRSLLENKWHFVILNVNGSLKVLTKEKSVFDIESEEEFVNNDISDETIEEKFEDEEDSLNDSELFDLIDSMYSDGDEE